MTYVRYHIKILHSHPQTYEQTEVVNKSPGKSPHEIVYDFWPR